MLPRKCKSCRCYVAPHLLRCPRCNTRAPALAVPQKPTKGDRDAERAKRDAALPMIRAVKMKWAPSVLTLRSHEKLHREVQRKLSDADTPRLRNSLRSELREIRRVLARGTNIDRKHTWTTEIFHAKHVAVTIFISPKGKRYVLATRDGPADLIVQNRKKNRGLPFTRLVLFERSPYARMAKKDKQDAAVHTKRKKAKKERRLKKRTPTLL